MTESLLRSIDGSLKRILQYLDKKYTTGKTLNETWLDQADVTQILKISTKTLQRYRKRGLKYHKLKGKIYYKAADIQDYLTSSNEQ